MRYVKPGSKRFQKTNLVYIVVSVQVQGGIGGGSRYRSGNRGRRGTEDSEAIHDVRKRAAEDTIG